MSCLDGGTRMVEADPNGMGRGQSSEISLGDPPLVHDQDVRVSESPEHELPQGGGGKVRRKAQPTRPRQDSPPKCVKRSGDGDHPDSEGGRRVALGAVGGVKNCRFERKCEHCGELFKAARRDARFCSAYCRYAARDLRRERWRRRGTLVQAVCMTCAAPFEYRSTTKPRKRCDRCRGAS